MTSGPADDAIQAIGLASARGRWIVTASVLGSGLAGIDSTVVSIGLPAIGRDLHVGFSALQWTVTSYTLTLAALILLGGALGDRYGRRRVFVIGVGIFAGASLLCAAAPNLACLLAARSVQGIGGALVTPASLAIIEASFAEDDRARAIGAWTGFSGTAAAVAPFVGGWLLAAGTWRWVFLVNPPLAVLLVAIVLRHVPETRDPAFRGDLDMAGASLTIIGLGGVTAGVIAAADHPVRSTHVWAPLLVGAVAFLALLPVEHAVPNPVLPPTLFRSAQFSWTNAVTFLIYAANGAALLFLVIALQTACGFSPLRAGAALLPITVVMLGLAARFGALAHRIGPRLPMTIGPLVSATGLLLFTNLSPTSSYWPDVLPAVTVFGFGLAIFVAPLTATVLGAVQATHAGIASGVNNAVARAAALIAIAALPALVGLSGNGYDSAAFLGPFRTAVRICVALHVGAAVLAAATVRGRGVRRTTPRIGATSTAIVSEMSAEPVRQ